MWIYVKKLHLLLWRTPKDRRSGWKPIPSVARVTGTKSRDYKARKDDCLEDSTQLICSFTFGSVRTRSKSSRITLMRRIFKPSPTPPWRGFSLVTDCQLETQVASARPFIPKGGQEGGLIRERTNPSHRRYPWLILNVASEPKASEHIKGVLSSRQLSLTFLIPETSSRVTLAALGIGFQPNLARHLAYEDE